MAATMKNGMDLLGESVMRLIGIQPEEFKVKADQAQALMREGFGKFDDLCAAVARTEAAVEDVRDRLEILERLALDKARGLQLEDDALFGITAAGLCELQRDLDARGSDHAGRIHR
jgi:hypothetical protein